LPDLLRHARAGIHHRDHNTDVVGFRVGYDHY
jgi:hypothetical protein